MTDIVERLRDGLREGDVDYRTEAADEIERLRSLLRYEENRFDRIGTHADGCWSWGPSHYECALRENERLRTELAELRKAQGEPFAWATFDGEGGHDLRMYENNENYRVDYIIRNGQKYADWVFPLYTSAPSIPDCNTCANRGEIDGLSQESHCEHCMWHERWRTNHYVPN